MIETSVASTATLALAGVCWLVAIHQSSGMDMGASTELGSFTFFVAAWASMMAAMMQPGAVPAVSRFIRADGRSECRRRCRESVSSGSRFGL
jgi:predicted metal-binding membrane protein